MRAVTAILLFVSGVTAGAETAGTVFINGNIYTVNDKQPFAQAIAVKCDRDGREQLMAKNAASLASGLFCSSLPYSTGSNMIHSVPTQWNPTE